MAMEVETPIQIFDLALPWNQDTIYLKRSQWTRLFSFRVVFDILLVKNNLPSLMMKNDLLYRYYFITRNLTSGNFFDERFIVVFHNFHKLSLPPLDREGFLNTIVVPKILNYFVSCVQPLNRDAFLYNTEAVVFSYNPPKS